LAAHDPLDTVHLSVALVPTGTPVTVVLNEFAFVIVAVPDTTLHTPVPIAGLVAFSVKLPLLHCERSAPATAALGVWLFVSTTSSALVHAPLVTVHLTVTVNPALSPVTVLVGDVLSVIVAPLAAPTIVHNPEAVPGAAGSAANVKLAVLHNSWSGPALAATGGELFVRTTTSEVEHEPLLTVHLRVALVPDGIPVTVVVASAVLVMVAVPASTVHNPVPGAAAFPARVKVAALQRI
jgi:hypothetical protein